jgi:lysophospholipase L1-like esterase
MRRSAQAMTAMAMVLLAASVANLATTPISRLQTPWWAKRFEVKQAELQTESARLVWLGDSITQNWETGGPLPWLQYKPVWDRFYGRDDAINLGFKGDSTCHVLWRLLHGELDLLHPKVLVLLIGANNFGHVHTDAAQTFLGIKRIVDLVHGHSPLARIILIGVLPSIRSAWVDDNTRLLNAQLKFAYERSPFVHFVDASPLFLVNGHVDPTKFIDPKMTPPEPALHPTAQAQAQIAELIAPIVDADLR